MDATFTQRWIRKFRILTISLIFSGALNIGLFTACIAILWQHREPSFAFPQVGLEHLPLAPSNVHLIREMSRCSFRELCAYLTNKDLVEEGYTKRDLALAVLGSICHVDIEKALAGSLQQRRVLSLGPDQTIEIYPALTDEQFKAVIRFVYLEKWPLTAEGLFKLIQKSPVPRDPSLEEAFSMSSPFYALQLLFQKTEASQDSSVLIRLASEGNWDLLSGLAREQMQMLDLSVDKRRRVLLSYLALKSATAAQLLVNTDFAFVLKNLDDQGIVDVLDLLTGEQLEPFCMALLKSPRSDAVWERCVRRLSAHLGKPLMEPFDLSEAIALFVSTPVMKAPLQPQVVVVEPVQRPPSWIMHTVQEGENLWKIARQYQVKVDEILKANDLEKDKLYPGMTLRVPPK